MRTTERGGTQKKHRKRGKQQEREATQRRNRKRRKEKEGKSEPKEGRRKRKQTETAESENSVTEDEARREEGDQKILENAGLAVLRCARYASEC